MTTRHVRAKRDGGRTRSRETGADVRSSRTRRLGGNLMARRRFTITAVDRRRYSRARARGCAEANSLSAVVNARYDRRRDCIELMFRGGVSLAIPRRMVSELETDSALKLQAIQVSPSGDALSWRALDADLSVSGLVDRAFSRRAALQHMARTARVRRSKR